MTRLSIGDTAHAMLPLGGLARGDLAQVQARVIAARLRPASFRAPMTRHLFHALPRLQVLPARMIGMGVRPGPGRVFPRA